MDSKNNFQRGFNAMTALPLLLVLASGNFVPFRAFAQDTNAAAQTSQVVSDPANHVPTFLADIQPVFMGHCSRCHNQECRFVYNWLDYKTAYADRWEIKMRVWDSWKGAYYKESMPIANSPESLALTDEQRILIRDWVVHGAPRGVAPSPAGLNSKAGRIQQGSHLFASICAACHQPTGRGLPNVFPPLAGSDFLNANKSRAISIVIHGRQGEVTVNGLKFNSSMPSLSLTDDDVANVLTFVYNSFGNSGLMVTPAEVKSIRANAPAMPAIQPAPPAQTVKSQFE